MKPGSVAGVLVLAGCVALCAAAEVAADAVTRHVRGPAGPGQRSLDEQLDRLIAAGFDWPFGTVCSEHESFVGNGGGIIRYGSIEHDVWTYNYNNMLAPSVTLRCDNDWFGVDPVPGVGKVCQWNGDMPPTSRPTTQPTTAPTVPTVAMPVSGDWTCAPVSWRNNTSWYDYDGDGTASVGDCFPFPPDLQAQIDYSIEMSSMSMIPGTSTGASVSLNKTCGGYTVVEIVVLDDDGAPADSSAVPPADLSCPLDSVPVAMATSDGASGSGSSSTGPSVVTTTTGRGVGVPVHSCPDGQDKDGALCYPSCRDGYSGSGPLCLTNCPSGYRDDGLYCFKPDSYGRGVGTPMSIRTKCSYYKGTKVIKKCSTTSTCGSKEECIGLCYNSCRDGYYAAGCNVCSPHCPSGMIDIGVSCMKGSYGRGVGSPMTCGSGEVYDAGLCYSACPTGASGVGPLCYKNCPSTNPYRLGVQCFKSKAERDGILSAVVVGTVIVAAAGAYYVMGGSGQPPVPVGSTVQVGPRFNTFLEVDKDLNLWYPKVSGSGNPPILTLDYFPAPK
jgi:hypothetical protein